MSSGRYFKCVTGENIQWLAASVPFHVLNINFQYQQTNVYKWNSLNKESNKRKCGNNSFTQKLFETRKNGSFPQNYTVEEWSKREKKKLKLITNGHLWNRIYINSELINNLFYVKIEVKFAVTIGIPRYHSL